MILAGSNVLVTGGGRGIGRGCALAVAERGGDVILNDRPGSPDLETTAEEIRAMGRVCHTFPEDVFSREGCERLVQNVVEKVDRIDAFVSNPAFNHRERFLDYLPADFERVLAGTLTSGFHMSQLVARHMVERGEGGRIVFISSVQAELPIAFCVAYGAAKAGLNHMMRTISVELSEHRINVNSIEPGWIDTPGEHDSFGSEVIAEAAQTLPLGRLGLPADIGKAAAFLCSSDADYITGSVLAVDGGFRYKDWRVEYEPPDTEKGS